MLGLQSCSALRVENHTERPEFQQTPTSLEDLGHPQAGPLLPQGPALPGILERIKQLLTPDTGGSGSAGVPLLHHRANR